MKWQWIAAIAALVAAPGLAQGGQAPKVDVVPEGPEAALTRMEAYLEQPYRDPGVQATLVLEAAEAAVVRNDYDAAESLLKSGFDRLDDSTAAGRGARAAVKSALARLARLRGDLRESVNQARAAFGALDNGDPARPWARLKMATAYAEAAYQLPFNNYRVTALNHLNKLQTEPEQAKDIRDAAAIVSAMVSIKAFGHARRAIADIDEILADPFLSPEVRTLGLIAQARLHTRAHRTDAAEAILQELSAVLQEFAPTLEVIPPNLESVSYLAATANRRSIVEQGSQAQFELAAMLAGHYVDITYCIDSTGKPVDIRVLENRGSQKWTERVVKLASLRRFAPAEAGDCAFRYDRIEVVGTQFPRPTPFLYLAITDLLEPQLFDRFFLAQR